MEIFLPDSRRSRARGSRALPLAVPQPAAADESNLLLLYKIKGISR